MPVVNRIARADRTKTRTVELDGFPVDPDKPTGKMETSTVTYRPSMVTGRDLEVEGEDAIREGQDDDLAFARRLCNLIVSWDFEGPVYRLVRNADGSEHEVEAVGPGTIPLVPEKVAFIDFDLLSSLYRGIVKAEAGNQGRRQK